MKIDFSNEQLVALYRNGGDDARKAVMEALGDEFSAVIPITERVKTIEDAIRELGDENPSVKALRSIKYGYATSENDPETADIVAFATLRVITEALNEGWKPKFTEDELRWYAWFDLVTKEEIEAMDDEDKCRVVGRAYSNANANGGLVYSSASSVSTYSDTSGGSRLAFKNEELAEYAAKQFAEIYADYCLIPKCVSKEVEAKKAE